MVSEKNVIHVLLDVLFFSYDAIKKKHHLFLTICTVSEKNIIHALLDVLFFSYDAIQKKHRLVLLLMDLKKSFDAVSHEILLKKLYHCGIRGSAYDLIESYLSNRN